MPQLHFQECRRKYACSYAENKNEKNAGGYVIYACQLMRAMRKIFALRKSPRKSAKYSRKEWVKQLNRNPQIFLERNSNSGISSWFAYLLKHSIFKKESVPKILIKF